MTHGPTRYAASHVREIQLPIVFTGVHHWHHTRDDKPGEEACFRGDVEGNRHDLQAYIGLCWSLSLKQLVYKKSVGCRVWEASIQGNYVLTTISCPFKNDSFWWQRYTTCPLAKWQIGCHQEHLGQVGGASTTHRQARPRNDSGLGNPVLGREKKNRHCILCWTSTGLQGHNVTCDNFFTSYALG